MLDVTGIDIYRGEAQILRDVSLTINKGEVVTLLGANGAGKTTFLEAVLGVHHPRRGTIRFHGQDIGRKEPFDVAGLGIACVPEGRRLFKDMSVHENLEMGAYPPKARASLADSLQWVFALFPILETRRKQIAGTLSGGEQQMLAIGRALMSKPELLLMDELSLGLSPKITQEIYGTINTLRGEGVTMLVIEQNATLALRYSDRGYVLDTGMIALQGDSPSLLANEHIRKAYLGM
jgi:branched-chain amino acid transport system ATP-binding protein